MREKRFILGSASPRRSDILKQVGISFEVLPSLTDEIIMGTKPKEIVRELSLQKARDVKEQVLQLKSDADVCILCADTLVVKKKEILGKPKDKEDVKRMLHLLQGKKHEVYTGVTLIFLESGEEKTYTFYERTKVYMEKMKEEEMDTYIKTGECFDKAGAYAIQGYGAKYIRKISGDFYNVYGLPIARIYNSFQKELKEYIK